MFLKYGLSIILLISLLIPFHVVALADRIVAVVEDKVITEQDLIARHVIKTLIGEEQYPYDLVRKRYIQELCLDKALSFLTKNQGIEQKSVSSEALSQFKDQYPDYHLTDKGIIDFIQSRELIGSQLLPMLMSDVSFSSYEVNNFLKKGSSWEILRATFDFQIAYSETPFSQNQTDNIEENSKSFSLFEPSKLPPEVLASIDWRKIGLWQFATLDENEYVAFKLNKINLSDMMDSQVQMKVYALRQDKPPSDEQIELAFGPAFTNQRDEFVRNIDTVFVADLSPLGSIDYAKLEKGQRLKPFNKDGLWLTAQVEDLKSINQEYVAKKIEDRFVEYLTQSKAADKIGLWFNNISSTLYINIINPDDQINLR